MRRALVLLVFAWSSIGGGGGLPLQAGAGPVLQWPGRLRMLLGRLKASDPAVRRKTIKRLASFPLGRIEGPLLGLLEDSDTMVRLQAAKLLVDKGSHRVLPRVRLWLASPESIMRGAALYLMRRIGGKAALVEAVKALRDMDPKVRKLAVETIGILGGAEVVPALLSVLGDDDWGVRAAAASALESAADPRAVIGLIGVLSDSRPEVRKAAVTSLGRIGNPRAAQAVLRAVNDSDKTVRLAALKALGRLRAAHVDRALLDRARRAGAQSERVAATAALGALGTRRAAAALVSLLAGPDLAVRREAALQLGAMGKVATSSLLARLSSVDCKPWEAKLVVEALGKIGDPSASAGLVRELGRSRLPDTVVLSALARCADWKAVPFLVARALAPDADSGVRALVAAALDRAADGRSRSQVVRFFRSCKDCPTDIRFRLVMLIGRIRAVEAFADVMALARADGDISMRRAAIAALGGFGDRRALGLLLDVLRDGPSPLRLTAANAALQCFGAGDLQKLIALGASERREPLARALALRTAGVLVRKFGGGVGRRFVPVLRVLAHSSNVMVALASVDALGASRAASAFKAVSGLAFDKTLAASVRCRAVAMLGSFSHPGLAGRLIELVRRGGACGAEAAWVLGKIGAGKSLSVPVARMLRAKNLEGDIRRNLVATLARVATLAEGNLLLELLGDSDRIVGINALAGLARLARLAPKRVHIPERKVQGFLRRARGMGPLGETLWISAAALGARREDWDGGAARYVAPGGAGRFGGKFPVASSGLASGWAGRGDWIVAQVVDRESKPRNDSRYFLGMPDGLVKSGKFAPDAVIHEEKIRPGTCQLVIRK